MTLLVDAESRVGKTQQVVQTLSARRTLFGIPVGPIRTYEIGKAYDFASVTMQHPETRPGSDRTTTVIFRSETEAEVQSVVRDYVSGEVFPFSARSGKFMAGGRPLSVPVTPLTRLRVVPQK